MLQMMGSIPVGDVEMAQELLYSTLNSAFAHTAPAASSGTPHAPASGGAGGRSMGFAPGNMMDLAAMMNGSAGASQAGISEDERLNARQALAALGLSAEAPNGDGGDAHRSSERHALVHSSDHAYAPATQFPHTAVAESLSAFSFLEYVHHSAVHQHIAFTDLVVGLRVRVSAAAVKVR